MKKFLSLIFLLVSIGCTNGEPPQQPPEETPPEEIPTPTPTPEPEPEPIPPVDDSCSTVCSTDTWAIVNGECRCGSDYLTLIRAGSRGSQCENSTGLVRDLCFDEQTVVANYRNFEWAADHNCPVAELGITPNELMESAVRGSVLHDGGRHFGLSEGIKPGSLLFFLGEGRPGNLETVNKRCGKEGEAPGWCGRSNTYRPTFNAFRVELNDWLVKSGELNGRGHNCDGIRHWCRTSPGTGCRQNE